jgi:hypothetical protein
MRREHEDAAADDDRLLDRVRDEQHREAHVVPQAQQLLLHLAPRERIERGEGLVHQQDVGLHGQRARDGDALLHAAGEHVRVGVGELGEADLVDHGARALPGLAGAVARAGAHREQHVLPHRLPRQQLVELLEHHHAVRAGAGDRPAVHPHLAFGRRHEPGHALEQRGLAAARGPQHDEAVGREHREAHAVGRGDQVLLGLVLQGDAVHLQQGADGVLPRRLRGRHQPPGRSWISGKK